MFGEWGAVRREEIYQTTYQGNLNPEEEQVPELLLRESSSASEEPREGPGDQTDMAMMASAGSMVQGAIPQKFIPEHGTVYLLALARVRPSYRHSQQWLDITDHFGNPRQLMAHPVAVAEAPVEATLSQLFADSSSTVAGYYGYNSWYRAMPDWWNSRFYTLDEGWPCRPSPSSKEGLLRHAEYDDIFVTDQYGHGTMHTNVEVNVGRQLGSKEQSVKMPGLDGAN